MNQIKNQIRKMIAEGTKIDMISLDYIEAKSTDLVEVIKTHEINR